MTVKTDKRNIVRSICALALAALITLGSMLTVAAAASSVALVGDDDKLVESPIYDSLTSEGQFHVISAFEVTVENGSESVKVLSSGGTVAEVLEQAGVTLEKNQIAYPALDSKITKDLTIRVLEAKEIELTADGETKDVLVPLGVLEESLRLAGVKVGKDDILSEERNSSVENISKLTIERVTYKDVTESEKIDYDTVKENSDKVELGETEVKTKGVEGEKAVVSRVKYIDGKKDSSEVVAEKVIKKPVDEVILVGTKGAASAGGAGTFTDENGVEVSYKYMLSGSGTAYTAPAGSLTATGNTVYVGGVAVNPNLIPYGSKLYIESVDGSFVYGYATAIDTGGALMDGSAVVDCFYFTYDECASFGRRDVNVYVID